MEFHAALLAGLLLIVNCFHGFSATSNSLKTSRAIVKRTTAHQVTDRYLGNSAEPDYTTDQTYHLAKPGSDVGKSEARDTAIYGHHASLKRETAVTKVRKGAREDCGGQATTCSHLVCESPKMPVCGGIKENKRRYKAGSIIHYYCNSGFALNGVKWNMCLASGSWRRDTPTCKSKQYSIVSA